MLTGVSLRERDHPFVDICNSCDQDEKLSICMRVVQHKWKRRNPTAFVVSPKKWNWNCRITKFYGADIFTFYQRMYACPSITVKMSGNQETEPSFYIGQGAHETQYKVYTYTHQSPAHVEGRLTGFSLNKLNHTNDLKKNYVYTPGSGSGSAVVSFRSRGSLSDYVLKY